MSLLHFAVLSVVLLCRNAIGNSEIESTAQCGCKRDILLLKAELEILKEHMNLTSLVKREYNDKRDPGELIRDVRSLASVAFDVVLSNDLINNFVGRIIPYDHEITNIGGAYDRISGVFRAPYYGTYLFSWTTTAAFGSSIHTRLEKNGVVIAMSNADSSNSLSSDLHHKASATKVNILTLYKGDRVYIRMIPGRGTLVSDWIEGHSGFSGTILFV